MAKRTLVILSAIFALIAFGFSFCKDKAPPEPTIIEMHSVQTRLDLPRSPPERVWTYLDARGPKQEAELLVVANYLDVRLGYPRAARNQDGTVDYVGAPTLHHTAPIPHPTDLQRARLPIDGEAVDVLRRLRDSCANPDGSNASIALCAAFTDLDPTMTAKLDDSWFTEPSPEHVRLALQHHREE